MTFRSVSLEVLLVVAAVLGARGALADPSPAEISAAKQAFESAVELEAEQHWADAAQKLRTALAVKDTPGLRFHLARCEAEQGQLVEASLDYDRASELLRQGAKAPDVQKLLAPASAELKTRIPQITVEIPNDLRNALVELDGKPYAPSELALGEPLNPGSHRLKVSAAGRRPFEHSFSLKEGEQRAIRAELPPSLGSVASTQASAPAAPSSASPSSASHVDSTPPAGTSRGSSPKLYLMLGESAFTVAGLALGIGYKLAESSALDRIRTAQGQIDQTTVGLPPGTPRCSGGADSSACTELRTAIDDHDRDITVSTVGFVCVGVGAAALLTTWFAYPNSAAKAAGPSIQPVVALGRVGLAGRF